MPYTEITCLQKYLYIFQCSDQANLFANILPTNWFRLAYSPIFTHPKFSHVW